MKVLEANVSIKAEIYLSYLSWELMAVLFRQMIEHRLVALS